MLNVRRCDSASAVDGLRQLLRERFPTTALGRAAPLPTGIPRIDEAVGGLPRPGLTELVCSAPSCGSQLFIGQLLGVTRAEAQRVALVDAGDAFDPGSWPTASLEHLVWVRARNAHEALSATDLLARDANLGLVIMDLRHAALAELRRISSPLWYRLQRAIEPTMLAGVILTPFSLVPSASLRLELGASHSLAAQSQPRPDLTAILAPGTLRQRSLQLASAG